MCDGVLDLTMQRRLEGKDETIAELVETLEYFVENVIIDSYDACDEPLNTAWDKAREAIRKHKENNNGR